MRLAVGCERITLVGGVAAGGVWHSQWMGVACRFGPKNFLLLLFLYYYRYSTTATIQEFDLARPRASQEVGYVFGCGLVLPVLVVLAGASKSHAATLRISLRAASCDGVVASSAVCFSCLKAHFLPLSHRPIWNATQGMFPFALVFRLLRWLRPLWDLRPVTKPRLDLEL